LYINNLSVANINKTSANNAYTYYKNSVVYLFVDSTYSISLSANTTWANNKCGAWIDFNRNATFDTIENLALPPFSGNTSQTNFTVPSNSNTTDTLRLRARLSYWGATALPCGNTLGEVEDYPVLVIDVPTLDFTISTAISCQGEKIAVNYLGDQVDSLVWNFKNGTNTYSVTGFNDSISLNAPGMFDLKLVGYIYGFPFVLDSSSVIFVNPSHSAYINLSSCNALDTGTVIQNLMNEYGCDSIITTNTQLLPTDSISIDLSSCNPKDTGTVVLSLSNGYGCDSIITTTTSLLPEDSTTLNQTSCVPDDIGAKIQIIPNAYGCDSVIAIITDIGQIKSSISAVENVLLALPADLSYQWINCDSNNARMVGDTNQEYTATKNGNYAVKITQGACVDTSECVEVKGLEEDCELGSSLIIYPNPTYNTLIIETCGKIDLSEFKVYNVIGESVNGNLVISEHGPKRVTIDFTHVAAGIYVIKTKSTVNSVTKK
jgi:hypothetical protein